MPSALTFDHVIKRYGETVAVSDLSFEVVRGEMFGLIGPDGAGKTTSIRLLCGLLHADGGSVRVLNLDPVADHRAVTAKVGYLSQRFSLYGDLSIDENVAFFAEIHGVSDYHDRRNRLLDMTQLTPFRARLADQLSGGMKQKLALACTLVHEPDVILLDEPTTGVDPVSRREFWKLLSQFLAQGITIFMSTPYLDEAERCTRVALLHEGRLLALDTPGHLRTSLPGTLFEIIVSDPRDAVRRLRALPDGPDAQVFGERLHVWLPPGAGHALPTAGGPPGPVEGTASAFARSASADSPEPWRRRSAVPGAEQLMADLLRTAGLQASHARPILPSLEDVFIGKLADARRTEPVRTTS